MPADAVAGGTSGGRQPAVDSTERRSAFLTLALVCRLQAAAIGHSDGADEVFSRHRGRPRRRAALEPRDPRPRKPLDRVAVDVGQSRVARARPVSPDEQPVLGRMATATLGDLPLQADRQRHQSNGNGDNGGKAGNGRDGYQVDMTGPKHI